MNVEKRKEIGINNKSFGVQVEAKLKKHYYTVNGCVVIYLVFWLFGVNEHKQSNMYE